MSAEAIVKAQARNILKDNFTKSIAALMILLLPFYIVDGVTTVISFSILNWVRDKALTYHLTYSVGYAAEFIAGFLLSPVINGYVRAHYKAAYSDRIDMKDVFYYFESEHYFQALSLNIRIFLRMFIPVLLLFSPVIIFDVYAENYTQGFVGSLLYMNARFLFCVMSTTTTVLYSLRYFTVFTVSADNPQFTPAEVFRKNKEIMKNRTTYAAKLILSFIPWYLLCLTVLPMLYVIPYLTQSLCVGAKWMTQSALEENEI